MQQLIINLSNEEFELLTTKAASRDLEQIAKIALDNHFQTHRYTDINTPPLDLSKRGKAIAGLEAARIDLNKPVAPDRLRFENDEDFEAAMRAFRWRLDLYEAEKATFARKRSEGEINAFGGVSCVL